MISRTLTIAAVSAALGLGFCAPPAEATGPLGGIIANGTQLNGVALEGVKLNSIRMQEPEEDDLDIVTSCQHEDCPRNGTQLNGIALHGVTSDAIRMQQPEEDDLGCPRWNPVAAAKNTTTR
jgi:hypothetical protein